MKQLFKKNFGFILIFVLGLIPLYPLLHSGLPVTHDGQDHVARIANFYQSLSEGNIIPRWAGDLNWGYGHPILMFLYPFPSYIASSVHFLGFNLVDSVKLTFGITYILSGVFMYMWMRNLINEKAGIVAAVLYMYAPYRFVDLHVRGAIGEHVAFMCIPLVFYFIYRISRLDRYTYFYSIFLSLSFSILLLSHNAVSIMILPLILIYGGVVVLYSKKRIKLFIFLTLSMGLGIGLSSFFLIPAFFEGKYTLRDIVTGNNEYAMRFIKPFDYLSLSWSFGGTDFLSKQIGLVQIFGVILSVFFLKYMKGAIRLVTVLFLFSLLFVLFIMLPYSDFLWQIISTLQKFQFPWRFLTVVVFLTAFLSSVPLLYIKNLRKALFMCIAMCAASVILYFPYYSSVQGYLEKPESFYSSVYESTTDTGESAPIWSVRFMEKKPGSFSEVIEGSASISSKFRNTTKRSYEISASTKSRIRENTLYFPNWTVYVNKEKVEVEFQDSANRGLITYYVPEGNNSVEIVFEDTKLRAYSNIISLISLLSAGLILTYSIVMIRKK